MAVGSSRHRASGVFWYRAVVNGTCRSLQRINRRRSGSRRRAMSSCRCNLFCIIWI